MIAIVGTLGVNVKMSNSQLNKLILKIRRRAEGADSQTVVKTFVDVGPLVTLLSSTDHQVIYGRRGTGKTHALKYVSELRAKEGEVPVYIDLRTIGSSGGLYSDSRYPVSERATRLLVDTLSDLHEQLRERAVNSMEQIDYSKVVPALDELAETITQVKVEGDVEQEAVDKWEANRKQSSSLGFKIDQKSVAVDASATDASGEKAQSEARTRRSGAEHCYVHFGSLGKALRRISTAFGGRRIWVILDEWSVVPMELQPYLADLIRRAVFPTAGLTVKIGAIEQRSLFQLRRKRGDYIGIELGADASADLNLDDFMVFDNDAERAKTFFQELLYRHVVASVEEGEVFEPKDSSEFIQQVFTRKDVFEEYVRAAEGVPRDAVNIILNAVSKTVEDPVSIEMLRRAAKEWYQRDKEKAVASKSEALQLLHWIIDKVIAHRRARAFLFRSDKDNELIDSLFDSRVLHILKHNISAHDQPGVRYNVYKIDYGCYVDLLTTAKAPQGLLPACDEGEEAGFVEVPPDDYRAIRRAILNIEDFNPSKGASGNVDD